MREKWSKGSKLPYRRELAAVCHSSPGGAITRDVSGHGHPGQPAFVGDLVDPRDRDLGVAVDESIDATCDLLTGS